VREVKRNVNLGNGKSRDACEMQIIQKMFGTQSIFTDEMQDFKTAVDADMFKIPGDFHWVSTCKLEKSDKLRLVNCKKPWLRTWSFKANLEGECHKNIDFGDGN